MAFVMRANGVLEKVYPRNTKRGFDLDELHALIGCDCIDVVSLSNGIRMVVDDEGYQKELPPNEYASALYWASGYDPAWYVRGTVVIGSREEIQ